MFLYTALVDLIFLPRTIIDHRHQSLRKVSIQHIWPLSQNYLILDSTQVVIRMYDMYNREEQSQMSSYFIDFYLNAVHRYMFTEAETRLLYEEQAKRLEKLWFTGRYAMAVS